MSFVGNFTSNYDRTSQTAGATTAASPTWHRRPSVSSYQGSEVSGGAHRRPSIGSRRDSVSTALRRTVSSLSRPGTADEIPPVPPIPASKEESSDSDEAQEVRRLARTYSFVSTVDGDDNPFEAAAGSSIDPASENFRARAWVKAMLKIHAGNEKAFKPRTAGVAFRNLSAFGYSAPTDYQKTVGNYALDLVGLARRAMGHGPSRVDILRDCEGLVHAGEMLVVLGPPGSGCTTFLKTIAGETHGFKLSKDTQINYQGRKSRPTSRTR
jgi:ATP-binding cassette, subfamily G (WHITE), member 2, PDR